MSRTACFVSSCLNMVVLGAALAAGPLAGSAAAGGAVQRRPLLRAIPDGYSSTVFDVKLRDELRTPGAGVRLSARAAASGVLTRLLQAHPGARADRLITVPEERLDALRAEGLARAGGTLPDLNLWFRVTAPAGGGGVPFLQALAALDGVEIVEPAPLPMPPPAVTPDFTANQGYVGPATNGIGAEAAWALTGGTGTGVRIIDVEYSWNQSHEDLDKVLGMALLLGPGDSNTDPFSDNNHGTAVLGEIIATRDSLGVTGLSYGADISLAPADTALLDYNPANAIALAVANSAAGDVILIEQQTVVCGLTSDANCLNCGPLEWLAAVSTAIQNATAAGRIVVEAAGNGGTDLDQAACGTTFDRTVFDSGAIIVGAGGSPASGFDRERWDYSCYGSRVDLQGWGDSVMTSGYDGGSPNYSDPDDPTDPNTWYRATFAGTSSASPIVTGAATNIQAICKAQSLGLRTSTAMRTLLVSTGSGQLGNTAEHIGPRPNIRAALATLLSANLSITKTGPATVGAGGTVAYVLTAQNLGPTDAQFVAVSDTLPANTTFVSLSSPAGWSCVTPAVGGTGVVTCSAPALLNGASAAFALAVQAANFIGSVGNTASISADNSDPNGANNLSTPVSTAIVSPADVRGTKVFSSAWGTNLYAGAPVTYTIVLTNVSAYDQFDNSGREFADILPPQLTLVGASATSGTATPAGNAVNWSGGIPAGGQVTITIDAVINAGAAGQTVTNQGTIIYDADGDGTNEATRPTDDPGLGGEFDPTEFQVLVPVPALSEIGLGALALLLLATGVLLVRRRPA